MRDELLELLSKTCPKVDFLNEKDLIEKGKLDSFAVLSILAVVSQKYDVEFEADDILPENLNDFESIYKLVNTVLDRKASGK